MGIGDAIANIRSVVMVCEGEEGERGQRGAVDRCAGVDL